MCLKMDEENVRVNVNACVPFHMHRTGTDNEKAETIDFLDVLLQFCSYLLSYWDVPLYSVQFLARCYLTSCLIY